MKIGFLAAVAAATIAGSASAGDWRTVNANAGGLTLIDISSVRESGPLLTGWAAFWLLEPEDDGDTDYMVVRVSLSCSDRALAFTSLHRYRANGSLVASNQLDNERTESPPDSNGDKIVRGFCDGEYGSLPLENLSELFQPEEKEAAARRARTRR